MGIVQHAAGIRSALPQPEIRAGLGLQHEGEVFRAHGRRQVSNHVFLADHLGRDVGDEVGVLRGVQGRRIDTFVDELGAAAEGARDRRHQFAHARLDHFLH